MQAIQLLMSWDASLIEIVTLSLQVSLTAVFLAALFALPLGALLAVVRFPGRQAVVVLLSALMGLPPVVVGLSLYLLLSRSGPLGPLGLLYTPSAMIIAQALLVTPIIAALTRETIAELDNQYRAQLTLLGVSRVGALITLLWDGRYRLSGGLLAGFGRAIAEVGAVLIVGGNIHHVTRVMTTTIALETSKGNLSLAMGLGMILILISILINMVVFLVQNMARKDGYA